MNGLFVNTNPATMGTAEKSCQESVPVATYPTPSSAQAHHVAWNDDVGDLNVLANSTEAQHLFRSPFGFDRSTDLTDSFELDAAFTPGASYYDQDSVLSPPGTGTRDGFLPQYDNTSDEISSEGGYNHIDNHAFLKHAQLGPNQILEGSAPQTQPSMTAQLVLPGKTASSQPSGIGELSAECICPLTGCRYRGSGDGIVHHVAQQHGLQIQVKDVKFICEILGCNREFDKLPNLRRHRYTPHPEVLDDGRVSCRTCGSIFADLAKQASHFNMQHRDGRRLFSCNFVGCDRINENGFRRRDHLVMHQHHKHGVPRPPSQKQQRR